MSDELRERLQDAASDLEARGLATKMGFGERPVVVVVDYTRAFTDPEMPLAADFAAEIEATRNLLAAARFAGHPRLFTAPIYDEPDLGDAGVWAIKVPASTTLRAGTPGVELDERLERTDDEALLVKKYASAFFGTDLVSRLNARRVDTILLAGCTTSGCVRATAVDGLQHGFRVMVVRQTVGDRNPDAHVQSMLDMQQKYADVVELDDAIAYLERTPAR